MDETWPDEEYYGEDYYDEYYVEEGPMSRSALGIIVGGCVGALLGFACAACLALIVVVAFLPSRDDEASASSEVTAVIRSEPTAAPARVVEGTVPTPAPEAAPLSTPPPEPGLSPLEILNSQSYVDDGWFHIVGEVRNNSDTPMEFVKVVATLYDEIDNVVGTDFAYVEIDVIPPGGKSPFQTDTGEFAGVTNYKLQVQGRPGSLPRQDLVILNHNNYVDGEWLRISGEVQNTGDRPAEFVKIVVTLYDATGAVVGTDFAYTKLEIIPPAGIAPFEIATDHFPNFDHYAIQVQGQ